jgi:hypothetical protein
MNREKAASTIMTKKAIEVEVGNVRRNMENMWKVLSSVVAFPAWSPPANVAANIDMFERKDIMECSPS